MSGYRLTDRLIPHLSGEPWKQQTPFNVLEKYKIANSALIIDPYKKITKRWNHQYDLNFSYLGAMITTNFPFGPLEQDIEGYGYYLIENNEYKLFGDLNIVKNVPSSIKEIWITHETLKLLKELNFTVNILKSYCCTKRSWALSKLAKTVRDQVITARYWERKSEETFLKNGYNQMYGMFRSEKTGPIYRPDWFDAIVSTARANLIRKIVKIEVEEGRLPTRIHTDSLSYDSDDPIALRAAPKCIRIDDKLGAFKLVKSEAR